MTDTPVKMNRRQQAKANTREKVLTAARDLFTTRPYHAVGIRDVADRIGMSTGAVFANFESKSELFEAAMQAPAPLDRPAVRLADDALAALRKIWNARPKDWTDSPMLEAWLKVQGVILEADGLAQSIEFLPTVEAA